MAPKGSRRRVIVNLRLGPENPLKSVSKKMGSRAPRCNAAKRWCFTWHDYPDNWQERFAEHDKVIDKFIAGQEVCPTTGRKHLQGYLEAHTKIRPIEKFGLPQQIHWEAAKGSSYDNYLYCCKEGVFFSRGISPPYSLNITLRPWQVELSEILNTTPNDRHIYWVWEPEGGIGKTTFQKWCQLNKPGTVVLSGKASDMKHGIVLYQQKVKDLPKVVLINIPRCQDLDHISWQGIEEIKDMFFFSPKYESGMVNGPNPHLMIFSNQRPPEEKLSTDRWRVGEIMWAVGDWRMVWRGTYNEA